MLQLRQDIQSNIIMGIINLFVLLLFTTVTYAESSDEDILKRFLDKMQTLEANFKQTLVDDQGTELESTSGIVFLNRPDKFRWDYKIPYTQTIVTNGESLWFYDEDLEQLTIRDFSTSIENTPAAIFGSYEDLDEQFIIIELGNIEEFDWIELTPRDIESQYNSIRLGFDKDKLGMMVMFDNLGQVTRIDFTEEVLNKKMDDGLFNFEPPQGIDIIDDRG
jgi:outer membrane lipoprotein carrier protein